MIKGGGWVSLTQYNKSYPTFVPNFKMLGKVVTQISLPRIFQCVTLEWEMEKRKNGKRRQKLMSASWFSFPQYTWPLWRCIQTTASARRGMNTRGRYHFLMYKNNLSMTIIKGKINGPWHIGHWPTYILRGLSLCHTDPLSRIQHK